MPQGSLETQEEYADEDFAPEIEQAGIKSNEEATKPPIKRLIKKPTKLAQNGPPSGLVKQPTYASSSQLATVDT